MRLTRVTSAGTAHLRVWLPRGSGAVTGVALVLHGGRSKNLAPVRPAQLPVLRMLPFGWALRRAGRDAGLAVARLRYTVRGWNGDLRSPVADVRWAIDELAQRFAGVPVALVGHSMGGRAALHAAGADPVRTVVLLAPWLEADDLADHLGGLADRRVLVAHGSDDHTTDPAASALLVQRARHIAASIALVDVRGGRHALLRRPGLWHDLATGFVLATLYDRDPVQTVRPAAARVLTEVLSGTSALVV